MRTTTRRRSRLRSSQYPGDRWKPSLPVVVLVAGLVVGSFVGIRGKMLDQSANLQEHYMLLVSDLYAQGAPLPGIRERLVGVGYTDPSNSVVTMANRLSSSRNAVQQQEGDQLHQFAEALVAGMDKQNVVTPVAETPPTPLSTPAAMVAPATAAAVATPVATVEATASPEVPTPVPPTPTTVAVVPPPPPTAAAPTAVPARPPAEPQAVAIEKGTIQTNDHKPATLRKDPSLKSVAIVALPYGTSVEVLGVVKGDAVEAGEARWYHLRVGARVGYVYFKLVKAGG